MHPEYIVERYESLVRAVAHALHVGYTPSTTLVRTWQRDFEACIVDLLRAGESCRNALQGFEDDECHCPESSGVCVQCTARLSIKHYADAMAAIEKSANLGSGPEQKPKSPDPCCSSS